MASRKSADGTPALIPVQEGVARECTLAALRTFLTPNELFYVRSHFSTPRLDISSWHLAIEGHVKRSLLLSYEDLKRLPRKTLTVTLECAGNGRSFLNPSTPGLQFHYGAVGTAEWTGVPLAVVLEQAGLLSSAKEVLFQGADQGREKDLQESSYFERSLPIQKALDPDTVLACEMNGEPLSPEHGYPVRLIVPGWYGMASVKWLQRIEVLDRSFTGYFQSQSYIYRRPGQEKSEPVSSIRVRSLITSPIEGEVLPQGRHRLAGVAWAPGTGLKRVEVSTDGGKNWQIAEISSPRLSYAWREWTFNWNSSQSGNYTLMVRAIAENGETQPEEPDWNEHGYGNNAIQRVHVQVR